MSGFHPMPSDPADPRPWYIVKMERETDEKIRDLRSEFKASIDDVRSDIRALKWTLAAVAALAALAGNLIGAIPQ